MSQTQPQSPFTAEQLEQLNQPLDPKRVKHRPGGGGSSLSYLEGHDVINRANELFGVGRWGFDLLGVEFNPVTDDKGVVVGGYYAARLKLTVAGCIPITEEGVCAVTPGRNPRATIDAHDMGRKGAVTDALKRAFRCYGDQFGNSLYNSGLVNGQPRPTGSNGNRPTSEASNPQRPRPNSNPNPSATQTPAAVPAQPGVGTARSTAAPIASSAAPGPIVSPRSPNSGSNTQPVATTQQLNGIRRLATNKGLSEEALEAHLQQTYGVSLVKLSQAQASEMIAALQKQS